MASFLGLHVVCCMLLGVWRAGCHPNHSELICSEHLGANKLSSLQAPVEGTEPQICVSNLTCCTIETEKNLRIRASKKVKTLLQAKYSGSRNSLLSIFDDLRDYFQTVMREGHRQSSLFLRSARNKSLTTDEVQVISTFFEHLQNYLVDNKIQLEDIVNNFFRDSFPLVLDYANLSEKPLSRSYKQCLKTNMESIQPFGNHPAKLVGIFEDAFDPARKLLSSFKFATEVMNAAQQFNFSTGCKNLLLEMKFCSLCQGLHKVKPCYSYCNEALRKCLIPEIKLQSIWGSFIARVNLLAHSIGKSDLENFVNSIYKDLWRAALYVIYQKDDVVTKVTEKCGTPEHIEGSSKVSLYTKSVPTTPYVEVRLFAKMDAARAKVSKVNNFYESLPNGLCLTDGLSARQDNVNNCWNGKSRKSSSGLSSSGRDLQMTNESSNHLKLLEEKIRDRSREIDKSIVHSMADDEESGSGSGEGNEIYGSACGDDDEDCGSSSGSNINVVPDLPGDNNDIYISSEAPRTDRVSDDSLAGGVPTTKQKSGKVLARAKASPSHSISSLSSLALLLFAMIA